MIGTYPRLALALSLLFNGFFLAGFATSFVKSASGEGTSSPSRPGAAPHGSGFDNGPGGGPPVFPPEFDERMRDNIEVIDGIDEAIRRTIARDVFGIDEIDALLVREAAVQRELRFEMSLRLAELTSVRGSTPHGPRGPGPRPEMMLRPLLAGLTPTPTACSMPPSDVPRGSDSRRIRRRHRRAARWIRARSTLMGME